MTTLTKHPVKDSFLLGGLGLGLVSSMVATVYGIPLILQGLSATADSLPNILHTLWQHKGILFGFLGLIAFIGLITAPLPQSTLPFFQNTLPVLLGQLLHVTNTYGQALWRGSFLGLVLIGFTLLISEHSLIGLKMSLTANLLRFGKSNIVAFGAAGLGLIAMLLIF